MLVTKAWRCNLGLVVSVLRVNLVFFHPRPPSVVALVYRACPCRDQRVCHRVQGDSVAKRQPCACDWCVSCHLVSVCGLVLCDRVPHCKTVILQTSCDSCVLWHVGILTQRAIVPGRWPHSSHDTSYLPSIVPSWLLEMLMLEIV